MTAIADGAVAVAATNYASLGPDNPRAEIDTTLNERRTKRAI